MALIITKQLGDFEKVAPGTYAGRCYMVVDLGLVMKTGMYPGLKHEVLIGFELDELMSDGRPFVISETYTASTDERAKLRQRLVQWRGRDFTEDEINAFDLKKIINVPALVNVIHERSKRDATKVYANIASLSMLPKGMKAPPLYNKPLVWEFGMDMALLPEHIRKRIGKDPSAHEEEEELPEPDQTPDNGLEAEFDDLIPF